MVRVAALALDGVGQAPVVVPAHVEELDAAHVAFRETPGEEAVRRVGPGRADFRSVEIEDVLRLPGGVHQLRDTRLHPECHFILGDPGRDLRISDRLLALLVDRIDLIDGVAAHFWADPVRIAQIEHRIARIAEFHPLVLRREESRRPEPVIEGLVIGAPGAKRGQHHIGREIRVGAAQTVAEPGSDAGASRQLVSGLAKRNRGIVVDRFGVHRADQAQIVRHGGDSWHQVAQPGAAFPVLGEVENAWRDGERFLSRGHGGQPLALTDRLREILSPPLRHLWLRIEEVHLGRGSRLEQVDDTFGFGGEVGESRKSGAGRVVWQRGSPEPCPSLQQ